MPNSAVHRSVALALLLCAIAACSEVDRAHLWARYADADAQLFVAARYATGERERDRLARQLSASQRNHSAVPLREWRAKPESGE